MVKNRNTKRALLMSALSLMLCMSMLIGSTFAWFTDSVTSAGNRIQAGTLQIELLDAEDKSLEGEMIEWAAKDGRKQEDILWEPGCTYNTEEFYIKNAGDLKLKFKFDVTGINGDAKLLEVIDFTCTADPSWFDFNTGAVSVTPAEGETFDILKGYEVDTVFYGVQHFDEYVLEPGEKVGPFVLSGHMDEEADNDYQGLSIENIAISLIATQATGEEDSFNGVYDENATYPNIVDNAEDLATALAKGENVTLSKDVSTTATTKAPYGNEVGIIQNGGVLDGNGNTLSVECSGDDYGIMTSGGTIKNLTIDSGCRAIMIMSPTGDIIVDKVNIGGDGVLYAINTGEAGADGVKLSVTNSTLAGWTSYGPVVESASFTNVKFEQGEYKDYASIYGRVLKPYVNTTLTDCSFIEHMNLDLSSLTEGHKVTFTNCTVNGQDVTANVFTPYSGDDSVYDNALFSVDLPSWADSIDDCIIFN